MSSVLPGPVSVTVVVLPVPVTAVSAPVSMTVVMLDGVSLTKKLLPPLPPLTARLFKSVNSTV